MPNRLYTALDSFDEDLLIHLDDEGHLSIPTAEHLLLGARQLKTSQLDPPQLDVEFPLWRILVSAFLDGYQLDQLADIERSVPLMGEDLPETLGETDRRFLDSVEMALVSFLERRQAGMDFPTQSSSDGNT